MKKPDWHRFVSICWEKINFVKKSQDEENEIQSVGDSKPSDAETNVNEEDITHSDEDQSSTHDEETPSRTKVSEIMENIQVFGKNMFQSFKSLTKK